MRCKNCYSDKTVKGKTWSMKSPRSQSHQEVTQYHCRACRKGFRSYKKVEG